MSTRVLGLGLDVVEVERVRQVLGRRGEQFLARILTQEERLDVGDPPRVTSVAARFAAKEAVAKALGTGIRGFSFQDVEVCRDALGSPGVRLHGGAARLAEAMGVGRVWLSLAHERSVAVAVVVLEGKGPCM